MSEEYVPNLEDFLEFEDFDNEDSKDPQDNTGDSDNTSTNEDSDVEDTTSDDVDDTVSTDVDTSEDDEDTDVEDIDTTKDTEEEDTNDDDADEDDDEDTSPDKQHLDTIYNVMKSSGLLSLGEDFEFDGSLDKLVEAVDATKNNLELEVAQNLWNRLPEDFRAVLEYGIAGGTDLNVVKEVVNNQLNLNKIDIENEDHQKSVVETYLKKTTKFSDAKIQKRVKMLYDADMLEDEASEVMAELKSLQEEEKLEIVAQEAEKRKNEQKALEEAYVSFSSIASDLDVSDTRKQQIVEAVWNTAKYDGQNNSSYVDYVDNTIRNNPEHFAQLVNIYLDYDADKGFKVTSKSSRKANTKAARNLRDTLQDLLSGNGAVASSSSTKSSDNSSGFNFEQFIKHG